MTLSIAAFSDIHAYTANIYFMRKHLEEIDVVILAGDMTNGKMQNLIDLIDLLKAHCNMIFAVCGNHDTPEMEGYLIHKKMNLHGTHRIHEDIVFLGCGGSLPYVGQYVFNEAQYVDILSQAIADVPEQMPKILVAHQPPYNTKLDRTYSNVHVGSHSICAFIEKEQPLICFTGHMHEATGIDAIGKTKLVNPGMVSGTNRLPTQKLKMAKSKHLNCAVLIRMASI